MKKWYFLGVILAILLGMAIAYAGDKEELQWKIKYLITRAQLAEQVALSSPDVQEAHKAVKECLKELDAKGFILQQDGTIAEKPKDK